MLKRLLIAGRPDGTGRQGDARHQAVLNDEQHVRMR
jgi:hypothetical protein